MFLTVTFATLLLNLPYIINISRTCVPNSQILVNGKICTCNQRGQWSEANCDTIERRQICQPGQVTFHGCSHCVCQENGQYSCSDENCTATNFNNALESLNVILPWCNPFRTYYISCNICVCPASGRTAEARCALDISCSILREPTSKELTTKKNTCIPNVMYLFPCIHCLCSPEGVFKLDKCVETCVKKHVATASSVRRCIPKTLYRQGCNVCRCPESSFPDDSLCTKNQCNKHSGQIYLRSIKIKPLKCTPHRFTKPRCVYCDCSRDGLIDESACLELSCLKSDELKYDIARDSCSPGEMVPICMECLCPRNGMTTDNYCSASCSIQSKLKVLEKVYELPNVELIIQKDAIKKIIELENCEPNSIYLNNGRYCICPENGNTNSLYCVGTLDVSQQKSRDSNNKVVIDFNVACEPSTFVDFDCNICYCSKKGKIDPNWCTYDDCEAKKIIQESHARASEDTKKTERLSETCNPGSLSKVECNYCICPDIGLFKDRVCTKNDCSAVSKLMALDKFSCEPLAYYEVDCNVCFCPRDGLKNVVKCTKNHCEKSFLRTDVCVAGQLFSDECNVCVCPPNGNKLDSACTNYVCTDTAPWKKIFQLSESLLGNQIGEDATRQLDLCFPGEEFMVGCKLCVCPDMGMRSYALCSPNYCDGDPHHERNNTGNNKSISLRRKNKTQQESCTSVNTTNMSTGNSTGDQCIPGSMYFVNNTECICPYKGNEDHYCRSLPKIEEESAGNRDGNESMSTMNSPVAVLHNHTRYECDNPGRIMDECFICECENKTVIEEHCFRNEAEKCLNATQQFLKDDNL